MTAIDIYRLPITDSSAWTRAEIEADGDWIYVLTEAEIDDLDRALALRPKVAKYYLYRGRARLGAKMISEGLGDFATAGRLATNDYQVAMEAGEVLGQPDR